MNYARDALGRENVSARWPCRVLGQPRSTQRRAKYVPSDEPRLVKRMVELGTQYGRYGYRRITALLRREGWRVNHKRVERLWRREGLSPPAAAETEAALAQRRLMRAATSAVQRSRVDIRLRLFGDA